MTPFTCYLFKGLKAQMRQFGRSMSFVDSKTKGNMAQYYVDGCHAASIDYINDRAYYYQPMI